MEESIYYDLGEINIFVEGDNFRFVNTGGTILDVNFDTAASIIALQGHTLFGAHQILKNSGIDIDIKVVKEVADYLKDNYLVNTENEKPKSRRFETKKVLNNLKNGWSGPLIIQDVAITASSTCPLNCQYCFRKFFPYRYQDKLNLTIIKRLLDNLRELGCLTVNISGGEPAAFPELTRQIGEYAKERGFENISVSTCGFKLTLPILKEWKKAGITYLNLSLDTMEEEVQDRISRKKGAWKEAVEAAENACKIGLQVRLNATCYQETIPSLEKLAEFGKRIGVYKTRYNPLVPSAELPAVSPQMMRQVVERVKKLEKKGFSVYCPIEPEDKLPDILICAAGITKAVVEVDGSVGGCQFMGNYPEPAGNLLKDDFITIWTKGNWDYFRNDLEERKLSLPCRTCEDRLYCISYCMAYAHALLGDGKVQKEVTCPWKKE